MTNLIVGQVEALLPALIEAMEAERDAKELVVKQKAVIAKLIGSPQTVKTIWGTVTLKNGRRTVKVTDKALSSQITYLKEQGVKDGRCAVNISAQTLEVKITDR